jgi:ArsR family transcriptional regulator
MKMNSYKTEELSRLLKIISDNNRLQILSILQDGEHCVCKIVDQINLSQSLISHHLRDLKDSGLVVDRKDGKRVYYSLTPKGIEITNLIFNLNQ